jgi:hypothetical protein
MRRVEWTEVRLGEMFRIIADNTAAGWVFHEQSIWEVRWFKISSTPEFIAKANELLLDLRAEKDKRLQFAPGSGKRAA